MARGRKKGVKHVTGPRTIGGRNVNPWNSGLGWSDDREIERGEVAPPRGEEQRLASHVQVTPFFHEAETPQKNGTPYSRLLSLLEELAALHKLGILAPDQRAIWTAQEPSELQRNVRRCIKRLMRLSALLGGGRAGCAAHWTVHLGGVEYPAHDIVRAVLGQVPPPIPFEDWTITTVEVVKSARR